MNNENVNNLDSHLYFKKKEWIISKYIAQNKL
jgi:hypothetical protein